MSRAKERMKFIHKPSTQEIYICLSDKPNWSQILFEQGTEKSYKTFLKWLIDVNYMNEREGRFTIKEIAIKSKYETGKITKWIHEIYNDLIELNYDMPHLFTVDKISVTFHFKYFDSQAVLKVGLDSIPRIYETVSCYFIQAKIGANRFWVSDIEHDIGKAKTEVNIWLEGNSLNRYRQMRIDEGLFKGWLGIMDLFDKTDFEIDKLIK